MNQSSVTQLEDRVQHHLGEAFVLERELGGGGMARVWVANERRLGRRVVVKVLRPELAAGVSVDRFRREILLAASLQHPHIVPVLGAGEIDGLPYFMMPFVEGASLRARLEGGPLAVPEAVRILRDVARALAVAHARGVVHRDIKPDNILLAGGAAVVADFGVAKALATARDAAAAAQGDGAGAVALTTVGTALGTPAYMAPEQVSADDDIGPAADVYAFGVTAYEMLAGAPPFAGRPARAVLAAHLAEAPRDVRALRAGLPEALADLVMHCLAKDPAARPADGEALVTAIDDPAMISGAFTPISGASTARAALAAPRSRRRRLVWGGAALAVAALAAALGGGLAEWGTGRTSVRTAQLAAPGVPAGAAARGPAAAPPASVAVLPFVYIGEDTAQSFMAASAANAVAGALGRVPGLRVSSRTAAVALQQRLAMGDTSSVPVRALVEGVLEREGRRLRLSVRLVDARDGFMLWADRFEGDTGNLFAMQDVVAAAMEARLRDHFALAPGRASAPGASGASTR